jgi:hypothetical protein
MRVIAGRAVILDYGIKQADGTWHLASAPGLSYATRAEITALPHAPGTQWRVEDIQHNPLASLPVAQIGVRFTGGTVVDYTVEVTDGNGAFYVWARNLDRALQLQDKTGSATEFNLRNYEVDFAHLDERRNWSRTVCSVPKARSAANDDESYACNVGNRRVWWTGESVWGVAA